MAHKKQSGFLILDELAQMDPKSAGEQAYKLASGGGKVRTDRGPSARAIRRWRRLFKSAGD